MTQSTRFGGPGATATSPRRSESRPTTLDNGSEDEPAIRRARGRSYAEDFDWGKLGVFAAGLAIGLGAGTGIALLLAPQSGEVTRQLLGRRARELGSHASDRWEDIRADLDWLGRRARRKVRRGMTRGRWVAQDTADRGRRRLRR
ncbi:MAG: YtxH domain-containing protein [Gemmatimonadaceae bacterium]